jgi:hypothetical protein
LETTHEGQDLHRHTQIRVDRQVNDWLAKSNATVRKTDVAFKPLRDRGWDAVAGKTTTRRAVAIAITAWYDEPYHQMHKPNPATDFQIRLIVRQRTRVREQWPVSARHERCRHY